MLDNLFTDEVVLGSTTTYKHVGVYEKRDPARRKDYGPFQHALKRIGFEKVLKMELTTNCQKCGCQHLLVPMPSGMLGKRSLWPMPAKKVLKES